MKLHDAIVDWCSKSEGEIMNSINLKRQSPNVIMCLLAMDGLNDVLPQSKGLKFTESVQYFTCAKTSRQVLEAGLDQFIPLIRHHREMVLQMFDIKINAITSDWQTLKSKLNLVNAIFRKTFGLTLKGNVIKGGNPNVFELKLMDCFPYVDGVMMLKLRSSKLIKSNLNQPKPHAPVGEALIDTKPIDLLMVWIILCIQMMTLYSPGNHSCLQTSMKEGFFFLFSQGLRI